MCTCRVVQYLEVEAHLIRSNTTRSFLYLPRLENCVYVCVAIPVLSFWHVFHLWKYQANNAYIFPGFGLGVVISGAIRVKDDMVLAAGNSISVVPLLCWTALTLFCFRCWTAEGLAEQVTSEHFDKGLIYPPFSSIRKISANIAARVAAKAYDLGKNQFSGVFSRACVLKHSCLRAF
jgi:malic enzyme